MLSDCYQLVYRKSLLQITLIKLHHSNYVVLMMFYKLKFLIFAS